MNKAHTGILLTLSGLAILALVIRQCGLTIAVPLSKESSKQERPTTMGQAPQLQASNRSQKSPLPRLPRPQTPEDILKRHNDGASGFDSKVRFWGKVVDQNGHPVEGVSIRVSVTTLRMIKTEKGYREFELIDTQSKSDGSFKIEGAEGFSLTIEKLTKPGYVLPAPYQEAMRFPEDFKYRFTYNSMGGPGRIFHPDLSSPIVFQLWRLRNPEPLVLRGTWLGYQGPKFQLNADATTHIRGSISIAVTSIGTEQAPEWEITVAAFEDDGGVAKADPNDAFMFEAPASGYQRVQKFRYGPEDTKHYGEGAPIRFFVRSKQGRWYSAADLIFFAPDANGQIVTKWRNWLNPNGSRNLEHDSANPILVRDL